MRRQRAQFRQRSVVRWHSTKVNPGTGPKAGPNPTRSGDSPGILLANLQFRQFSVSKPGCTNDPLCTQFRITEESESGKLLKCIAQ
jgi:hypothetical protein